MVSYYGFLNTQIFAVNVFDTEFSNNYLYYSELSNAIINQFYQMNPNLQNNNYSIEDINI